MPKKKTNPGRAIVPATARTNLPALPATFAVGGTEVRPEQFYRIPERHPDRLGPWSDEIDKLAWRDAASGLDCILLRQPSGVWAGYVGIDPGHPLYGYRHDAIPAALRLSPHGGLDYSAPCQQGPRRTEATRVCHVSVAAGRQTPHSDNLDDDKWWLGFECDKPGDLVPVGPKPHRSREEGEVYRTIDFAYRETVALAGDLARIGTQPSALASSPPTASPPSPKLGAPVPQLGKR